MYDVVVALAKEARGKPLRVLVEVEEPDLPRSRRARHIQGAEVGDPE